MSSHSTAKLRRAQAQKEGTDRISALLSESRPRAALSFCLEQCQKFQGSPDDLRWWESMAHYVVLYARARGTEMPDPLIPKNESAGRSQEFVPDRDSVVRAADPSIWSGGIGWADLDEPPKGA